MDNGIDEFSAYYIVIPVDCNCIVIETILSPQDEIYLQLKSVVVFVYELDIRSRHQFNTSSAKCNCQSSPSGFINLIILQIRFNKNNPPTTMKYHLKKVSITESFLLSSQYWWTYLLLH